MRHGKVGVVALLIVALFAASCSATPTTTSPGTAGDSQSAGGLLELIELIPPSDDALIYAIDVEEALEELRIGRNCSTDDRAREWMAESYSSSGWFTTPSAIAQAPSSPEDLRAAFGFDGCSITAYAELLSQPSVTAMRVDVDASTIDDAVRSDPDWSDLLGTDQQGGTEFYDWGDEFTPELTGSPWRRLPIGGQLAVIDGADGLAVVRTTDIDVMRNALTARQSETSRLALRTIVTTLTEQGSVALAITSTPRAWSELVVGAVVSTTDPEELEQLFPTPEWVLEPWTMMGAGTGFDGDGEFLDVALFHVAASDAKANADRVEQMIDEAESLLTGNDFSEQFAFESAEVQDTTLLVRLRPAETNETRPRLLARFTQIVTAGDVLFATG